MTRLPYAEVIGDPIAHSKSPVIHGFWLQALDLKGDYRAAHVRADEVPAFFERRRADPDWRGCNVTIPHKEAVISHLDRLTPLAAEVGAVNTVTLEDGELLGDNTDVLGIMDAVPALRNPASRACLIGSGGAALGAMSAFQRMGVGRVDILVRNAVKGEALLGKLPEAMRGRVGAVDDVSILSEANLIVNASVLGMAGKDAMPRALLDGLAGAGSDTVVFDMVYHPLETDLLKVAGNAGLRAVDGLHMLVGQAAAAFERFFDALPPRDRDSELRALLTS